MTVSDYNKCVDEHADGVYRFILKNIKDKDKADDIVQDAFLKMWDKAKAISSEKAKSYLFTAAYHTMIDYIRKEKKTVNFEEKMANVPAATNDYSDLNEVLSEAADKLPEVQKSVLLLRDYEGYSYEEIGNITNLSESQVKVYIYRARNFMKQYIGSPDAVI